MSQAKKGFIPGSDAEAEEIFQYPFTAEEETVDFLREHGRIMFIVRGLSGTGKNSLAAMLSKSRYPNAVVCCADDYFDKTFSSKKRTPQSLAESHEFCKRAVLSSCEKGIHPVVVKNTHVKKRELQNYLNIAADYNYTVIMASTLRKFIVSPEILAKSNTKGLDSNYLSTRLKQWQDILPVLVGWFMSESDSLCLLAELHSSLDHLLGDGKFCRIMNAYDIDKLHELFDVKQLLYCIAACSEHNDFFDLKIYYNQENVKENYGRCFTLIIQGFLVTATHIFAIIYLEGNMKDLHKPFKLPSSEKDPVDELNFDSLRISPKFNPPNLRKYDKTVPFSEKLSQSENKPVTTKEWEESESIHVGSCSCMLLAVGKSEKQFMPWPSKMLFHSLLAAVADSKGCISLEKFGELEDGYKYCRLPSNAWIIRPPYKILLKSVFTGMYT